MTSSATSVSEYLAELPRDRREIIEQMLAVIRARIPAGYEERMSYGMIGYVVPHELYPPGYHCTPALPLPFLHLASQKNYISLYHGCIQQDPELLAWWTTEYQAATGKKPTMGASCIRFRPKAQIPYELIGQLAEKYPVDLWIQHYEKQRSLRP